MHFYRSIFQSFRNLDWPLMIVSSGNLRLWAFLQIYSATMEHKVGRTPGGSRLSGLGAAC